MMFENLEGIKPMGLKDYLDNHKKTILHKHKNVANNLKM